MMIGIIRIIKPVAVYEPLIEQYFQWNKYQQIMTGKFGITITLQRPLEIECVLITKASILVHFQLSLLDTGTLRPEPEPPLQLMILSFH